VLIWGVTPSGPHESYGRGTEVFPSHPRYNSVETRNVASEKMNHHLEDSCKKLDVPFLSVWHNIVNSDNYMHYFMDQVHLNYYTCKDFIYSLFGEYVENNDI
jgi:hypothetical protein